MLYSKNSPDPFSSLKDTYGVFDEVLPAGQDDSQKIPRLRASRSISAEGSPALVHRFRLASIHQRTVMENCGSL